ncbi:MAG: tyrosine-type recombinase/integrase [Candidatus Marinimicrobia bacterium]|nr:tyrosine-type recombinase/integrase [Candidatus Neomarinimicrobiota bacterium]
MRILAEFTRNLEARQHDYYGKYSGLSLTFRETYDMFIEDCKRRSLRPSTIRSYEISLDNLSEIIPYAAKVNQFNEDVLRQFTDSLRKRVRPKEGTTERRAASINVNLRSVRTYLNWLYERHYIPRKIRVKLVKIDKKLPKILTPDELTAIYKLVEDPKLLSTYRTYQNTGMRLNELFSCTREGNYLRVSSASKGRKERVVPLPEEFVEDYEMATKDPYLPEYITKQFTKFRENAGVAEGKTLHSLRHTFACNTLIRTNNLMIVKSLLGHASVQTSEIYLQFPEDYLKEMLTEKVETPTPPVAQA